MGTIDGVGDPLLLIPSEYYEHYIYTYDFVNADIGYNEIISINGYGDNHSLLYDNDYLVEFAYLGTPEYGFLDWESLRLIFEEIDGKWYLVCIVHGMKSS